MSVPAPPPARDSWRGCLAIAVSLLGLTLCVCLAIGLSAADRLPNQLDRYLPLTPGTASLYRVTYADGSQGFLSINVTPPDSDSITYSALYNGDAIQVHSIYTNWQGGGETYTRDDYYSRNGQTLSLVAQKAQGQTTLLNPPITAWSSNFLNEPVTGETNINNNPFSYRQQAEGEESIALPDGRTVDALKIASEWQFQNQVFDRSTTWYVPDVGVARHEEFDGQGKLIQQLELLTSTRLSGAATPPILQSSSSAAFFREDAARTGAHLDANLPDSNFKVAYRLKLNKPFTASPAVADGLLYVADQAGMLTALDAEQGTVRWQFGAGGAITAAPAVAAGIVYVGASDKTLYALEASRGLFLWSRRLYDNVATSPVVADGALFVGGEDRTLYALDALTGEERWTFIAGDRIVSSPAVAGGRVFFGSDDSLLYALDAATGKMLWRYAFDLPVEGTPAVSPDGIVYAGSTGAKLAAVEAATGNELWSIETRFGFDASPAVGENLVFAADQNGALFAYNRRTGELAWEWRGSYGDSFVSSPLLLGKVLLATNSSGVMRVFEADSGQVLHSLAISEGVSASPTWDGETVFITTQNSEVIALRAGAEVASALFTPAWQYAFDAEGDLDQAPYATVHVDGAIYAALHAGDLVALDAASGEAVLLAQFGEIVEGEPAYDDGVLFVGTRTGSALAYDLNRRQLLWRAQLAGDFRFGPAIDDERVYVHGLGSDGKVYALDRRTGATLWAVDAPGGGRPVLADGALFVSADAILALNPATGDELWRSTAFTGLGSLAVYEGVVYAGGAGPENDTFIALDAATGRILWQSRDEALFFANRPSYDPAGGAIFVGATNGQLYAYEAKSGQLRWRFQADGAIQSDTQVQNGVVYFTALSGTTYAVNAQTGNLLSNFKPGTTINTYTAPLVLPDRVFTVNGLTLYALDVEK
jgi:outer membrane protein assembly factor BamB